MASFTRQAQNCTSRLLQDGNLIYQDHKMSESGLQIQSTTMKECRGSSIIPIPLCTISNDLSSGTNQHIIDPNISDSTSQKERTLHSPYLGIKSVILQCHNNVFFNVLCFFGKKMVQSFNRSYQIKPVRQPV